MASDLDMAIRGVNQLFAQFKQWDADRRRRQRSAMTKIGQAWVKEAKKRVPVDTGRLRNSITKEVIGEGDSLVVRVGSNVEYAKYVEFGTADIAGGRVQALGTGPVITDEDAITSWPAKERDGARREQMPFLRPAGTAIQDKAIQLIQDASRFQG